MPFNTAPCCTCDGLTGENPTDGVPCIANVKSVNACCRISGQPVASCDDLSCLVIAGTIVPLLSAFPGCEFGPLDACMTNVSGLQFEGDNGEFVWEVTLEKIGDCTATENAFYVVASGSISGRGILIEFERDPETGEIIVDVVDGEFDCGSLLQNQGTCSSLNFTGSWHIGYHEDDLPLTMNLAIAGVVAHHTGDCHDDQLDVIVSNVNTNHVLDLISYSADACGYVTGVVYGSCELDHTYVCDSSDTCVYFTAVRQSGCRTYGTVSFGACAGSEGCSFAFHTCGKTGYWCGCGIDYSAISVDQTDGCDSDALIDADGMTVSGDL